MSYVHSNKSGFTGLTSVLALKGGALFEWVNKSNAVNFGNGKYDELVQEPVEESGGCYSMPFVRGNGVMISTNQSPITSININHASRLLLTTWRAPNQGHNILLGSMIDAQDPYIPGEILSGGT
jgi:hypothetical protein